MKENLEEIDILIEKILNDEDIEEPCPTCSAADQEPEQPQEPTHKADLPKEEHQTIIVSQQTITPEITKDKQPNNQYDKTVEKLLINHETDREDLTWFISKLKTQVENQMNINERPQRIYFESLTQALKTRSETNTTMIGLLNSLLKHNGEANVLDDLNDLLND